MITKQHKIYNIVIIFAIIGLMAPLFSFAEGTINIPVSTDVIKDVAGKTLDANSGGLWTKIKNVWNDILSVLKKIYNWLKTNIWPKIKPLYDKILKPEVDKRKSGIGGEIEKEKQEMTESAKQDLPNAFESLITKIKSFFIKTDNNKTDDDPIGPLNTDLDSLTAPCSVDIYGNITGTKPCLCMDSTCNSNYCCNGRTCQSSTCGNYSKMNVKIFLFTNLKTCVVGDRCVNTSDCTHIYKNGNIFLDIEKNSNYKAIKPSDPTLNNYQVKQCLEAKLDAKDISYLKGEINKFINLVYAKSNGSLVLSPEYVEIPATETTMQNWNWGLYVYPSDLKGSVANFDQYVTKNTDFIIVTNDIYDDTNQLHWGIGGCGGTTGADNGLNGAAYSWIPKTNPGFWFQCAEDQTYMHEWLHAIDSAMEIVTGIPDAYHDNFPKSLCGKAYSDTYKWFPSSDTAQFDPDFAACTNYYGDFSGYCSHISPVDCSDDWNGHIIEKHYNPAFSLIGNLCRNGKKDSGEIGTDCGGICAACPN